VRGKDSPAPRKGAEREVDDQGSGQMDNLPGAMGRDWKKTTPCPLVMNEEAVQWCSSRGMGLFSMIGGHGLRDQGLMELLVPRMGGFLRSLPRPQWIRRCTPDSGRRNSGPVAW